MFVVSYQKGDILRTDLYVLGDCYGNIPIEEETKHIGF
jgi:hypothetical protein